MAAKNVNSFQANNLQILGEVPVLLVEYLAMVNKKK